MSAPGQRNGNFDPPRSAVLAGLDNIARSCGWRDRREMREAVLRARGKLTPEEIYEGTRKAWGGMA